MKDIKKIEENGNEEVLHYFVYSTMPFVSHRDVVIRKQALMNFPSDGSHVYAFESCNKEQCPIDENYIRSDNKLTGYTFKPAPEVNGTKMEWI